MAGVRLVRLGFLAALCGIVLAGPAGANDSTAAFAAGGLVLTETDAIGLVHEELYVSRAEVRVRYVFRNATDADVETLVAFPLPDIDISYYSEVPIEAPTDEPDNFVGFTVKADGVAIEPSLHVTATLAGKDVTEILAVYGVPISRFAPDLYEKLWALPRADQDALQARGLAYYERDYEGVYPQWTQHAAFTWMQRFPAGQDVVVEHAYHPVVGTRFISEYTLTIDEEEDFRDRYCLDGAAVAERLAAAGASEGLLLADEVGYVLTTANNWAGPIGRLDLTVDIGVAGNLAATCAEGLVSETPTTLVGSFRDVEPTRDLWVLVIRRDPES
ncbi:MAG: DUF4424 family protein [Alphaproteobacteria bacterium]